MTNLDYLAAKYGQRLVQRALETRDRSEIENSVQDASSILSQQGIFALFLWLHETSDERPKRFFIAEPINALLHDVNYPWRLPQGVLIAVNFANTQAALDAVSEHLVSDVRRMFLVRDLIAQLLMYARHCAKAS